MHLHDIIENLRISELVKQFPRSSEQLNQTHESDAELLQLSDSTTLAIATDSISEELELGFYEDPFTMGWVLVNAAFSDIAASAASPLGITTGLTISSSNRDNFSEELFHGIHAACKDLGTFLLGGDLNYGSQNVFSATALGLLQNKFLTRKGISHGDRLFATGHMGLGNWMVWKKLQGENREKIYRPKARLNYREILLEYATATIDTSDGFISGVDQLMRINQIGFHIDSSFDDIVTDECSQKQSGLDPLLFLAAQHGEFELLFTVPSDETERFKTEANKLSLPFIELGEATPEPVLTFASLNNRTIDTTYLRNLYENSSGDMEHYLKQLFSYGKNISNFRNKQGS